MAFQETAAKKRKKRKTFPPLPLREGSGEGIAFAPFAPFRGSMQVPVCNLSNRVLTMTPNINLRGVHTMNAGTARKPGWTSPPIQPNRAKSSQIQPNRANEYCF
jgi:hypothetical protein